MSEPLLVLLDGKVCGELQRLRGGKYEFIYAEDWQDFPLSLSMPIAGGKYTGEVVSNYFWGLLTDNEFILRSWAKAAQISWRNLFGLLAEVGEDCAGAVQVLTPEKYEGINARIRRKLQWLSEADIAARLRELGKDQAAWRKPDDIGRLSLAGALPKTAFLFEKGRWAIPSGRTPTTHIFKPPMQGLDGQAVNEHICLRLAQAIGLPAANSQVMSFEDQSAIVVERYDRLLVGKGKYQRLHQEDMCQALGLSPTLKYQNDGGPSVGDITGLIRNVSSRPDVDVEVFIKAQMLNWLIGGTDAHAKNYSLLLLPGGNIGLAPLYDITATLPFYEHEQPSLKLAMKIGKNYNLRRISGRDWKRLGEACGVRFSQIENWVEEVSAQIMPNLEAIVDETRADGLDHKIMDDMQRLIAAHMKICARQFS